MGENEKDSVKIEEWEYFENGIKIFGCLNSLK